MAWMAWITVSSEGVPPKAGTVPVVGAEAPSPVGSSVAGSIWLTSAAVARVWPATAQSTGFTTLVALSTLGTIWQLPALRSVPNQATTSDTAERLGSVALSCASEALKSVAPFAVWTFSGNQDPKPSLDWYTWVPSTNSPAPGSMHTERSVWVTSSGSGIGGRRMISAVICGMRLPKASSAIRWNTI